MAKFDVVVIGGGPGGYVAAIKGAQLGLKVACIDSRPTLGGTCLNVGCIPSKALLNASEKYVEAHHLDRFGVGVGKVSLDLKKMLHLKDQVVDHLTKGIAFLFKKNKIEFIQGHAEITAPGKIMVRDVDKKETVIDATNIVIATGSESTDIPNVAVDEKTIVSSTGALSLSKVPKSMVVIGGGYIGLEMGSVWQRLGAKVTVIEFADTIVPMMDQEVAAFLKKSLETQGMSFKLSTKVSGAKIGKHGVTLSLADAKGDKPQDNLKADVVLVSVGRRPNTDGLGLDKIGVKCTTRGFVEVGPHYETNVSGVYAIGDVIPGPMLAHKAEEEGVAVMEYLAGQKPHVNYDTIPGVIYTMPEVATVGKTEQELKADGVPYNVGKFPFSANSRAKATGLTEGFVKILAHQETDRILGAHIISADAGTLISEFVLGMEYKASSEDIARTCHPHPTTSEALKEAALAAHAKPIHM